MITAYLLLPKIHIHNANAMSSMYTIGFPAMTAWLGAVHGLQRKLAACNPVFSDVQFVKTAVICHTSDLQIYKDGYRNAIIGTANPLKKKGGSYERPPFIAEARIHLCVSLLIEVQGLDGDQKELAENSINRLLPAMKMASGDIMQAEKAEILYVNDAAEGAQKKIIARLMPGYALIERRDLLEQTNPDGASDGITALLHCLSVHCQLDADEAKEAKQWIYERKTGGWIIPISVGFKGISPLGHVEKQRDPKKLHRFVENAVTLGEFKMPYRFNRLDDMMWHYEYDEEHQLYVCKNQADRQREEL